MVTDKKKESLRLHNGMSKKELQHILTVFGASSFFFFFFLESNSLYCTSIPRIDESSSWVVTRGIDRRTSKKPPHLRKRDKIGNGLQRHSMPTYATDIVMGKGLGCHGGLANNRQMPRHPQMPQNLSVMVSKILCTVNPRTRINSNLLPRRAHPTISFTSNDIRSWQ